MSSIPKTADEWIMNKEYKIPNRNFNGIQFEELRRKIDAKFNNAHDELSKVYYEHWRQGDYSVDFKGYKPKEGDSLEKAKELFDKLHGLIFHKREIEFHQENLKQPVSKRIPEEKYNFIRNEKGDIIGNKHEESLKKKAELEAEGIKIDI